MLKFNPNKANCTGCSACYSVCPTRCISMIPDEEGFLYPVASDACTNCKLCEKVCPLNNEKKENDYLQTAYAAISKDYSIWHRSASGGAFSEIVRNWADDETLIVGAVWDGIKVHHLGVIGFENIAPLCKSKYLSSEIQETFIEIRKHLRSGKKAIFCGCPCQVDGLLRFLIKKYDNLLTIDLICHGQGSPLVFKECLKVIEKQIGEKIISYEFRSKRKIHEFDYLSKITTTKDERYITHDPYQQLFFKQDILRPSCGENCKYRDCRRPGDLTIADGRGAKESIPQIKASKFNYSTIVCNSPKGNEIISGLSRTMDIYDFCIEKVIEYNPLFAHQTWFSSNRNEFFSNFKKNPIETITNSTTPVKENKLRLKTIIKTYIPTRFIQIFLQIKKALK